MTGPAVSLALAAVLIATGCGGSGPNSTTAAPPTTTTTGPARAETRDPLPDRPGSWERFVNERGGYALLVPRGWQDERRGPQSLIRSYDRLVATSIAPDRARAAQATPLGRYATATAEGLRGYERRLDPAPARRLDHRYEAVEVRATGRSREGVRQRVAVVALRRDDLVTLTVVLAATAKPAAGESVRIARRMISTLRTRRPAAG